MISLIAPSSIGDIIYCDRLTAFLISPIDDAMGRKQINEEQTIIRLPEGSLARIDAVLEPKEPRAGFFREAVERELKRRERKK